MMKTTKFITLASSLLIGLTSYAQLDVTNDVVTTVDFLAGDSRRITQTLDVTLPNDPETNVDGITFNIDKALDAAGGLFSGSTLDSVNVTIGYEVEDINLTITNNRSTSYTGGTGEAGNVDNDWLIFDVGAGTGQNLSNPNIESSDFAGTLLTQSTDGVTLAAGDSLSAGPVDYSHTETRDVSMDDYAADYSGNGSFANIFNTDILTSNNFSGGDIAATQNVGAINFLMEVEYIVVPEPGTLMMAGIALGSAGLFAFARRRKRC